MEENLKTNIPLRILLVDSSTKYAKIMHEILSSKSWDIDLAFGVEEAIEKFEGNHYDLCIVGNRLREPSDHNDESELELVRELKRKRISTRFIINSSFPTVESVRKALSVTSDGMSLADDFISKIEGAEVLIQSIERVSSSNAVYRKELFTDAQTPQFLVEIINSVNVELIHLLKKNPDFMYQIQPHVFEELVAELLANYGWQVDVTKRTRDGGYDIFAIKKDISGVVSSWIVECKRYRPDRRVGLDIVRSLYSVKTDLHVGMSMIATTSYFSKDVMEYKTSRYDLELRDFKGLVEWVNEYRPHSGGRLYLKENKLIIPGE